jgi:hypothetical protein
MREIDPLERFGRRVGYAPSELAGFKKDDPRVRHMERLAQAAPRYSIVAEVIQSRHCNTGHRPGQKIVMDIDGAFITKLCPKRMCVYLLSQLALPAALINERLSEGLDPNGFHFMRRVYCLDAGVENCGYGAVTAQVSAWPRAEVEAWARE